VAEGPQVDVLIVGAGPAGAAAALALRQAGVKRVALVSRPAGGTLRVGESATPDVSRLLERLGLSGDLAALGHQPHHGTLSVWGGAEPVADDFLRRGFGSGWHLDRAAFDEWLRRCAVSAGAHLITPASLAGVEPVEGRGWRVSLRQGQRVSTVTASVLMDASGRKAALATRLGAHCRRLDRLVALAVMADPVPQSGLVGRSLVEAVPGGWWYAAALPSGRAIVTLMSDDDLIRENRLNEASGYRQAWQETTILREMVKLPAASLVIKPFSAASQYVDQAVGVGWVVIGDALIGFDPLSSSGIAGALSDALAAVDMILCWGRADGAASVQAARTYVQRAESTLRRYLSERQSHYCNEQRWIDRPFWQRRVVPSAGSSSSSG